MAKTGKVEKFWKQKILFCPFYERKLLLNNPPYFGKMWKIRIYPARKQSPGLLESHFIFHNSVWKTNERTIRSGVRNRVSFYPGLHECKKRPEFQSGLLPEQVGSDEDGIFTKRRGNGKFLETIHAADIHLTTVKRSLPFPVILEKSGNLDFALYKGNGQFRVLCLEKPAILTILDEVDLWSSSACKNIPG